MFVVVNFVILAEAEDNYISDIMKNIKELRKILADCLRDLRNDFELIEDYSNVAYDVGYMRALCYVLGKDKLGNMISAKFMNE